MSQNPLHEVYSKFRVYYYRDVFRRIQSRELSLTTTEAYCIEVIGALGSPTINEFADFIGISPPNATYKVNSMIKKGYLTSRLHQVGLSAEIRSVSTKTRRTQ